MKLVAYFFRAVSRKIVQQQLTINFPSAICKEMLRCISHNKEQLYFFSFSVMQAHCIVNDGFVKPPGLHQMLLPTKDRKNISEHHQ